MSLIDTHCHLDFHRFDSDRRSVIERARDVDVARIIVPAVDLNNCGAVLELADKYESIYAAVGVHPNSSANWRDRWLDPIREMAEHPKVVAIGEIGLDYYRDASPDGVQRHAFRSQLQLALELGLPVIVHNRESDADLLRLLSESASQDRLRGVLHSFSSDWETARAGLDLGFYLGFTGPVTYKKAEPLRQIVAKVPESRLLVETDSPFLAPQRFRGKRNEPAFVSEVVECIARVRGEPISNVADVTTRNAQRLFGDLGL